MAYTFRWLALWPLLAVALSQDSVDQALGYARSLMEPDQQPQPVPLAAVLEEVIAAAEQGQEEAARSHLVCAVELAEEMGYL